MSILPRPKCPTRRKGFLSFPVYTRRACPVPENLIRLLTLDVWNLFDAEI